MLPLDIYYRINYYLVYIINTMHSRFPLIILFLCKKKPCEYALGETWAHETDLSKRADHHTKPPRTPVLLIVVGKQGSILFEFCVAWPW